MLYIRIFQYTVKIRRATRGCSKQATSLFSPRAYARGLGLKPPLSLIFYKIFTTCAKEIKCFRILFCMLIC